MKSKFVRGISKLGFHDVHYLEWNPNNHTRTVVCAHGLTRNALDFEDLAQHLSHDFRVISFDFVGRGQSDWLGVHKIYDMPQYCGDANALLARLDINEVHWIGTSMGGILGMILAAQKKTPIRTLVLNDVGSIVCKKGLKRIAKYASGHYPTFDSLDDAEKGVRERFAKMGEQSDAFWKNFTKISVKKNETGGYTYNYDPKLLEKKWFRLPISTVHLEPIWQQINCPAALIYGELSDILEKETVEKMKEVKPSLKLMEVKGVGHTPTLCESNQMAFIKDFLLENA